MNLGPYAKALSGAVTATLLVVNQALIDGKISQAEWVGIVATLVAAAGTTAAADARIVRYAKPLAVALSAGFGALGTALATTNITDLSAGQWIIVVLALLGSPVVVNQTPNALRSTVSSVAVATGTALDTVDL